MNQQHLWENKWSKVWHLLPATLFAKKVRTYLQDLHVRAILDVWAWDGKDSKYFAKKWYSVTSLDISASAIQILQQYIQQKNIPNITPRVGDLCTYDSREKFDVIYAHLSLHYFDHQTTQTIFRQLHNLLNPFGYLFVKCKSIDDSLAGQGTEIEKDFYFRDGKYQHFFSKDYLETCLQDFEILRLKKSTSKHQYFDQSIHYSHFVEAFARKKV